MKFIIVAAAMLGLAGCAQGDLSGANTASMPLNPSGGPELNQGQAISLAGWALANPANTAGKPGVAARALAAEDWLAGQTMLYGNFGSYAPGGELSWSTLRQGARRDRRCPERAVAGRGEPVAGGLRCARSRQRGRGQGAAGEPGVHPWAGPDAGGVEQPPPLPGWGWAFAELNRNEDRSYGNGAPGIFR